MDSKKSGLNININIQGELLLKAVQRYQALARANKKETDRSIDIKEKIAKGRKSGKESKQKDKLPGHVDKKFKRTQDLTATRRPGAKELPDYSLNKNPAITFIDGFPGSSDFYYCLPGYKEFALLVDPLLSLVPLLSEVPSASFYTIPVFPIPVEYEDVVIPGVSDTVRRVKRFNKPTTVTLKPQPGTGTRGGSVTVYTVYAKYCHLKIKAQAGGGIVDDTFLWKTVGYRFIEIDFDNEREVWQRVSGEWYSNESHSVIIAASEDDEWRIEGSTPYGDNSFLDSSRWEPTDLLHFSDEFVSEWPGVSEANGFIYFPLRDSGLGPTDAPYGPHPRLYDYIGSTYPAGPYDYTIQSNTDQKLDLITEADYTTVAIPFPRSKEFSLTQTPLSDLRNYVTTFVSYSGQTVPATSYSVEIYLSKYRESPWKNGVFDPVESLEEQEGYIP